MVDGDDPEGPDPSMLTDDDLKAALLQHGAKVGPIVGKSPLSDSVWLLGSFFSCIVLKLLHRKMYALFSLHQGCL